jgi:hypothetical protein
MGIKNIKIVDVLNADFTKFFICCFIVFAFKTKTEMLIFNYRKNSKITYRQWYWCKFKNIHLVFYVYLLILEKVAMVL